MGKLKAVKLVARLHIQWTVLSRMISNASFDRSMLVYYPYFILVQYEIPIDHPIMANGKSGHLPVTSDQSPTITYLT